MSQENVELVKAVQPTDVDLVKTMQPTDVATALRNAFSKALSEDFAVHFISSEMTLPEYPGVDGLVRAWGDRLAPWASY